MKEIEKLANGEEVYKIMLSQIKKLSEDEKIRQQCQAREDYERRMIGEYNRGERNGIEKGRQQGIEQGIEQGMRKALNNLLNKGIITIDVAADELGITVEELDKKES